MQDLIYPNYLNANPGKYSLIIEFQYGILQEITLICTTTILHPVEKISVQSKI